MSAVFNDEKSKGALRTLASMSDKASGKQLNAFLDAEARIRENMFKGKYITEEET